MATVTGLTAERMQEIIDATIVGAHITGDDLILELFDATEINAGDVRGPQGIQGLAADVGDVKSSIRATITGWLKLDGTSIPNANTAYPTLWALADLPASWKSGTTLLLPDMTGAVVQGGGTIGSFTGDNAVTLDFTNLPPHTHTGPSHTHTGPNHTHSTPDHTHSIAHDHASFNTALGGTHEHTGHSLTGFATGAASAVRAYHLSFDDTNVITAEDGQHSHAINIPAFSGTSGSDGASTTGPGGTGATGPSGTGATGPGPGTSQPVDIQQRALRLNWFIYTGEV